MSHHHNPFAPIPRPLGIDLTPRPRTITDHTAASAYLLMRQRELVDGLDILTHAGAAALAAGDVDEAAKLLEEARPLREQLAGIRSLEVTG